jgi:hypothetical protein
LTDEEKAASAQLKRENDAERMRRKRENPDFRERGNEVRKILRSAKSEKEKNTAAHQNAREDPLYRQREQERDTLAHQNAREDPLYRQREQERNTLAHQNAREDPLYRQREQERDTLAHQNAREDPLYRQREQESNTLAHQNAREDPLYRQREQERDTVAHQNAREDPLYLQREQERNTLAHQNAREDPLYRQREQERNTLGHQNAREDFLFRLREQERNTEAHQNSREDPLYRQFEQKRNTLAHRDVRKNWETVVKLFEANIKLGPTQICNCCGRLFFPASMKKLSRQQLLLDNKTKEIVNTIFLCSKYSEVAQFCSTCLINIKSGIVPNLCLSNGLNFPEVHPVLKCLTRLEERLVSGTHIFQTIWPVMGPTGQYRSKGGIVNVPVCMDTTVSSLPRSLTDSQVVHLRLARKMEYVHDYVSGNVRPRKVWEAAQHLVSTPVYQAHGITLSDDWKFDSENENIQELHETDDGEAETDDDLNPVNPGSLETLLQSEGVRMAPAEGYRPVSILLEADAEFLAWPSLFGGYRLTPHINGKPISYSEVAKSIAMRYDSRAVGRSDYILFMAKKLELLKMTGNISICLRKKRLNNGKPITAGDLLNQHFVAGVIQDDNAYRVLDGVRSSCTHWHQEKLKVLAMVRQFGLPSLFITLSAAETQWLELLVILKDVNDGLAITENEAAEMSYNEKARLIQANPVVCARYFDMRFRELKKTWHCADGPFGGYAVTHYYYRVEFQQRGSPHVHMLLWLSDCPVYTPSNSQSQKNVCSFIDSIISCSSAGRLESLIPLQTHRHTRTCRKRYNKKCRFGIPFYPMDSTCVLDPLPEDYLEEERLNLTVTLNSIREDIENIDRDRTDVSFNNFLQALNISHDIYLLAIRSSLKKSQVFLKRSPADIYINPYSPKILSLMRSNMDVQFVLDAYACACYIIDYVNKSDRGLSNVLETALQEIRNGNHSIRDIFKTISSTFYNNSEMSVQEACYNILQLRMSEASEQTVFIPTGPPDRRVRVVKSTKELQAVESSSTDILIHGLLEHYVNRPTEMENVSLAEFAAWYEVSKTKKEKKNEDDSERNEGEENREQELFGKGSVISLKNGYGYIRKRNKAKVIRFVRYKLQQEPEMFYRECLMLYFPWRNESAELINVDCEEMFKTVQEHVLQIRKQYNFFDDKALDAAMDAAADTARERESDTDEDLNAPRFDFDNYRLDECVNFIDVSAEMGEYKCRPYAEAFRSPNVLPETELEELYGRLNQEQRDYVMHICHHFQNSEDPIYHFITGGAGVGKSVLINAVYQTLLRIFNSWITTNPDKPSVLLCAPTGKAAFHIQGQTLHTAFQLPINNNEVTELSADIANTMATKLQEVKAIIIDEISMVGEAHLRMVDARLRHLFNQNMPFGGKSLVAVGDFHQLPPVMDKPVYGSRSQNPYVELFGKPLWHLFSTYELTEIMRQRNIDFKVALSHLAKGIMTPYDEELFKRRTFSNVPNTAFSEKAIHLFYKVDDADAWNNQQLQSMIGEEAICESSDVVVGDGSDSAKASIKKSVQNVLTKTRETMGLPRSIHFREGARYMMTSNIDTGDGLVNGVTGILKRIERGAHMTNSERTKPLRVWLEFEETLVGQKVRARFSALMNNRNFPASWTPVEPISTTIKRRKNSNLQVLRKQFPLVPAEALTIHKSQGQTYPHVVVHLKGRLTRQLLYVACSRATCLEGLYLIGTFKSPSPIALDDPLTIELKRQSEFTITPRFSFLHQDEEGMQIIYHNVQSFRKHWKQVAHDKCFTASDVVLLGETWTVHSDVISIPDFQTVCQSTGYDRSARGACCLVKNTHQAIQAESYTDENAEEKVDATAVVVKDTLIVGVYASPRASNEALARLFLWASKFETPRKLIVGDFNRDVGRESFLLRDFMSKAAEHKFSLRSSAESTTRNGTAIDVIFSNFEVTCGVYESLMSYHKPIWIKFKALCEPIQND